MSIDWFTFAAQIVNFLILIWLLKRLLYGPIVRAMAEREDRISQQFADAEAAQSTADDCEREFRNELQELAQARETMTAKAGQEVDAWREEQLRRVRADVEDDRRQWHQVLRREKHALYRELQLDVTQHAVELGRHLLKDLADQSLQTRLVDCFISRLDTKDLHAISVSPDSTLDNELVVESSHVLSELDQSRITDALRHVNSAISFRSNPQLICGIELQAFGCRYAWNFREALAEVESDLIDAIEAALPGDSINRSAIESDSPSEITSL